LAGGAGTASSECYPAGRALAIAGWGRMPLPAVLYGPGTAGRSGGRAAPAKRPGDLPRWGAPLCAWRNGALAYTLAFGGIGGQGILGVRVVNVAW